MKYIQSTDGRKTVDYDFYGRIGIDFDNDGDIVLNGPVFAKHICQKYGVVLHQEAQFYTYRGNHYQMVSELKLKRRIFKYINKILDDQWTSTLEGIYFPAIQRACALSDSLQPCNEYINLKNGLLSIVDWEIKPHDKSVFTTTQLPVKFSTKHKCPQFTAYLDDIFDGDQELIMLIQEIMGYCLSDGTQAQKIFYLIGKGSNGKSILCKVIEALVGKENVTSIPISGFSNSFELASIVDKKVNISSESETVGYIKTDKIKQICTGDSILINQKYKETYSYQPIAKLIFSFNTLPKTLDTSKGYARRLCIIPFKKEFSFDPVPNMPLADTELLPKLLAELGGILNFALKGLHRLKENNYRFTKSQQSEESLSEYLEIVNPMLDFIKTNMIVGGRVAKKSVYEGFKEWARGQGYHYYTSISAKEFYPNFVDCLNTLNMPVAEKKSGNDRFFVGVQLKSWLKAPLKSR